MKALRRIVLLAAAVVLSRWAWDYWREYRFDKLIAGAAQRYQLDPALIKAVAWQESRLHPGVRGRVGEMGLMQVRETTAMEWASSVGDLTHFDPETCFNPATNLLAGSWYLKKALQRYPRADDPAPFALAEYNAGRANVLKWETGDAATNSRAFLARIQFPSTRDYITAILQREEFYRKRGDFSR